MPLIRGPKSALSLGISGVILVGAASASAQQPFPTYNVAIQPDGSIVTPVDQVLTPAGIQITLPLARPNAVAVRPDEQTAAFLVASFNSPVRIVNLRTGKEIQEFAPGGNTALSYDGILYSRDGTHLYVSQDNGKVVVLNVAADGTVSLGASISIPQPNGGANPGGLALSVDGQTLYVVLNRYNALGMIDLTSNTFVGSIPVENSPRAVVVKGSTAYVTNEGGRIANSKDFTVPSSGTPIVADPLTGASTTGTVSVVDLNTKQAVRSIPVGLHPTGMLLNGSFVFVANTNGDSVSVIDTRQNTAVATIPITSFPNAPFGSSPNALAMTAQQQLVVALGTNNALGLYQWNTATLQVTPLGLIPTGWYPGSVAYAPNSQVLVAANIKGVGSLGPALAIGDKVGPSVFSAMGTASVIPVPNATTLSAYTAQVFTNNRWNLIDATSANPAAQAHAIPQHTGEPSSIKHVFLIVKENRTYDQVFGDDPRGNGDPAFVDFGQAITPNHHALAKQFALLDNFYGPSINSSDGHQWVTQAIAPDYIEKSQTDNVRSYPFNGGDSLVYTPSGFIWRNALAHGVSVRVYGEYADVPVFNVPLAQLGGWSDFYQDSRILEGLAPGPLHVPVGAFQTTTLIPSLEPILNKNFPLFTGAIPDQYRADIFLTEFRSYIQNRNLPQLIIMTLPDDHTTGTSPGLPTPNAAVADNDLALGRVIDAISHSPYWPTSAIFVEEDDEQAGVDHVDGHRNPGLVISPFAQHRKVVHEYYTQINVVRTIEQILGLPPMNQFDLAAEPMATAFRDLPILSPYDYLPNTVPLDQLNPQKAALNGMRRAWALASERMFAHARYKADQQDPALLNRAIWYSATDFRRPYPGDGKILFPNQVARSRPMTHDDD